MNIESIRACGGNFACSCCRCWGWWQTFSFFPFFLSLSSTEAREARFCSLQRSHISAVSRYELASHHNFPLFMRLWHCYIIRVYDVHVRNNFATYAMSSGENRCLWYDDAMQTFAIFFPSLVRCVLDKLPTLKFNTNVFCSSLIKKMFFLPLDKQINKQTYSLWSAEERRLRASGKSMFVEVKLSGIISTLPEYKSAIVHRRLAADCSFVSALLCWFLLHSAGYASNNHFWQGIFLLSSSQPRQR